MDKIVIFRPNIELEAIARQSVEASREVDCAYFGNIDRNSGYFLLPIFLGSYLIVHGAQVSNLHISNLGEGWNGGQFLPWFVPSTSHHYSRTTQ